MRGFRYRQTALLVFGIVLSALAFFRLERGFQELERPVRTAAFQAATLPASIETLPGFEVTQLYSASEREGSWVSMTFDPQGRIIVSPQAPSLPLLRLTLSGNRVRQIKRLPQSVSSALGLLYASNSLFLVCVGPQGLGVYRMADQGGGDFGTPRLLLPLDVWSTEHGDHSLAFAPDGKLYVVCGDHTSVPAGIDAASPFQNEAEDQLLPQEEDPSGAEFKVHVPDGFVLRMDTNGGHCELVAGGMRNVVSIAFNSDGEMFGADNDHESDIGLPWYRPCRIYHLVPGGDYGHRPGSGKYPVCYEDALPPVRDLGLGAPSGMKFAPAQCAFPPRFRDACLLEDWAFGRLLAIHLIPHGSTYEATVETVLRGPPLNLVAMDFGPDGALYFIVGGRITGAGLYRLTWDGSGSKTSNLEGRLIDKSADRTRQTRRELESFEGRQDPRAVDFLWPSLGSDDRWLRYAARRALESQGVAAWKERALVETNSEAGLTALLALARCAGKETQPALLASLGRFPLSQLNEEQKLLKLRLLEVSFVRKGRPDNDAESRLMAELDPLYPSASISVNHELCQLLLYLRAPDAIAKSMALLKQAPSLEEQIYYVACLRCATNGWTLAERKDYLAGFVNDPAPGLPRPEVAQFFKEVGQTYHTGKSFDLYLRQFQQEAVATLSAQERQALAKYLPAPPAEAEQPVPVSNRKFVKAWRMEDLLPRLPAKNRSRHLARGRAAFAGCGCVLCHRFGSEGGPFGPDLSAIGSRASTKDILESILVPSKTVAPDFQNSVLTLKDGDVLAGRIIAEDEERVLMITEPVSLARTYVPKVSIATRRLSNVSPMPEGLVDCLTEDEIWDLIARLQAGPGPPPTSPILPGSTGY